MFPVCSPLPGKASRSDGLKGALMRLVNREDQTMHVFGNTVEPGGMDLAVARYIDACPSCGKETITLDAIAAIMETVAASGLPNAALELAGTFSEIARELMRGRKCQVATAT